MKLVFIFVFLVTVGTAWSTTRNYHSEKIEMRQATITPENDDQVQSLSSFFEDQSSTPYFYRGGIISEGNPVQILFPVKLERRFQLAVRRAGLEAEINPNRIKMTRYEEFFNQTKPEVQHSLAQEEPTCLAYGERCPADRQTCCNKQCKFKQRGAPFNDWILICA